MRDKGSVNRVARQRDRELVRIYHRLLRENPAAGAGELMRELALAPSPRFWITEERAADVMRQMRRGRWESSVHVCQRRRMFEEIKRRCERMMAAGDDLRTAVRRVVNSPAPEFYLTEGSVRTILYRELRRRGRE
ncbi:MAG: hypothetical protein LUC33_03140 [Prevotellaceae bacterium]|nr:hypothetical protein [Prevotellaceae bacterium]